MEMMKHKAMVLLICLMMLFTLTGCQLAKESGAQTQEQEDKLAGVYITIGYLNLYSDEDYLLSALNNTSLPERRLYAELKQETDENGTFHKFIFPADGFSYFTADIPATEEQEGYITTVLDGPFLNSHTAYSYGDKENNTTMEATLYVSKAAGEKVLYFNPVFKSADGRVYLVPGHGMASVNNDDDLSSMSQFMTKTDTVTENGITQMSSLSYKISVNTMYAPKRIVILQMDADSQILFRKEYAPNTLPESITPEAGTAYFMVEEHSADSTGKSHVTRTVYTEDASQISTFFEREDGLCETQTTLINRPE
jgi:hypothetical protein